MLDATNSRAKQYILIVDDDVFTRTTFHDALEKAGFVIKMVSDGASAIASLKKLPYDLVLLDLMMPGIDGFETCQNVRAIIGYKHTPILVITGLDDAASATRAFDAGATDFITKPIDPELLVHRVRYALRASQSMAEMRSAEDRIKMLKEAVGCLPIGIGITISDIHGKIIYANTAEAEIHGYVPEEIIGMFARQLAPPSQRKPFPPDTIRKIGLWERECMNIRKNGEEFPVRLSSIAVRNTEGECIGIVTACEDITSKKRAEERIQWLAYYDTLTGLPNRLTLLDRLRSSLAMAHRERRHIAILFLDLDNFKDVNDTLGHDLGDKLLREVAGRLVAEMRECDTVARLGGDEFVVVLNSMNGQESASVAAQRILSIFSKPFIIEGRQLYSSASIGIAVYPDDGRDVENLLKCADAAMYHAKEEGRSHFRFFSSEINQRIMRRVAFESQLREGFEKNEFFLHYQPQWDLQSGRMVGVEALLRWQNAEFGLVPPSEFIPFAEISGLIFDLGKWVLRTACIQARKWELAGYRDLRMAVNISAKQFRQPDFLDMVEGIIRETEIESGTLELEFTESVIMERADKTINTLRSLKEMGIQLSIDDFGTGYSSLNYLKHFPIDRIKIDRSFVTDVNRSNDDAAIVEAIISMAHSLNLKVIAEGVENNGQMDFLFARECNEVQGFYLAKPMTSEELTDILEGIYSRNTVRLFAHDRFYDMQLSLELPQKTQLSCQGENTVTGSDSLALTGSTDTTKDNVTAIS